MKTHWCCLFYRTSQHEWQPMPFINSTSNDSNSNLSDHYEFWVRSVVLEVAWIPRTSTILQYASVDRAKDWTLRACWRWFLRLDYLQRRVFGHGAVAPKSVVSTPKILRHTQSDETIQIWSNPPGCQTFFSSLKRSLQIRQSIWFVVKMKGFNIQSSGYAILSSERVAFARCDSIGHNSLLPCSDS